MAENFVPGLQRAQACTVRKLRELPIPGKILVKENDVVSPQTLVAQAELPGDVQIIRIAELLGVEASDVKQGLRVAAQERVSKGQILCEHKGLFGLFRSQYPAPCDGVVEFVSESLGHLGLRLPPQHISLNAYCGGRVCKVHNSLSVEIETVATIVQGIFGVGGERSGTLHLVDVPASKKLQITDLPPNLENLIVVGGTLPNQEVLTHLAHNKASGLVVGGIDDIALCEFLGFDIGLAVTGNEEIPFSLMVTEGFGDLELSHDVLELLKPHQGKFACMNGTTQIRAGAVRPELIVPTNDQPVADLKQSGALTIGTHVRLIRVPYFGKIGELVELPVKPEKLEAGSFARVLRVRLEDGRIVTVPRANAEVLIA